MSKKTIKTDGMPVAVTQTYDLVKWLLPKVESMPRAYKFTVGERLSANGLDLLTTLVEAAYSRQKDGLLEQANRKINSTRYLLRLAKDLNMMSGDSWAFSAEKLDEIGRIAPLSGSQRRPGHPPNAIARPSGNAAPCRQVGDYASSPGDLPDAVSFG